MARKKDENECKHDVCTCKVKKGEKYCSVYCEDASRTGVIELACECQHASCAGELHS